MTWGPWWACQKTMTAPTKVWVVSRIADQRTVGTHTGSPSAWMVAYPLQIRWRDSDSSRFSLAATATVSATATTADSSLGRSSAGGASPTVVGLAVGCTALAVILVGIVSILVYRRRRRRQVPETLGQGLHIGQGEAAGPVIAEMPDPSLNKVLPSHPSQQTDFRDSLVLLTLGILHLRIDIRLPLRQERRHFRPRL